MKTIVVFCAIALLAGSSAAEAPNKTEALQSQVRLLKAENKMLRATVKSQQKEIAALKKRLARSSETRPASQPAKPIPVRLKIKTAKPIGKMPPLKLIGRFISPIKRHQAGPIKGATITQVVSDTEAFVTIAAGPWHNKAHPGHLRVSRCRKDVIICLTGVNTKGFVDGKWTIINKMFYVAGTRKYKIGKTTKIAPLLKPLPPEWHAKLAESTPEIRSSGKSTKKTRRRK